MLAPRQAPVWADNVGSELQLSAAHLHELFVSLRRELLAVVKEHLMEQLDIVVNFLQCVQALGHFLDSRFILPQPRGCRKKQVYLACLSTTRQGSFFTLTLLSMFPRTAGFRQTLSCSFTVTPPCATPTDRSSTAFSSSGLVQGEQDRPKVSGEPSALWSHDSLAHAQRTRTHSLPSPWT